MKKKEVRSTADIKQLRNLRTQNKQDIYYCHSESPSGSNQEIYYIKNETKGKTEEGIKILIRRKLDLEEDEIHVWNRMILTISRFRLNEGNILFEIMRLIFKQHLQFIRKSVT